MALSKSTITGRVPLPTDENLQFAELTFALSGLDTEGSSVLPGGVSTRIVLIDSDIPPGFELWQNTAGLRGTHYRVLARWTVKDRDGVRDKYADLGVIQIGSDPSYTLSDLINNGVLPATGTFWSAITQAQYDAVIQAAADAQASAAATLAAAAFRRADFAALLATTADQVPVGALVEVPGIGVFERLAAPMMGHLSHTTAVLAWNVLAEAGGRANVMAFGCLMNGSNDTIAMQAALDSGIPLTMPHSNTLITDTLFIDRVKGVDLNVLARTVANTAELPRVMFNPPTKRDMFKWSGADVTSYVYGGVRVKGLSVDGDGAGGDSVFNLPMLYKGELEAFVWTGFDHYARVEGWLDCYVDGNINGHRVSAFEIMNPTLSGSRISTRVNFDVYISGGDPAFATRAYDIGTFAIVGAVIDGKIESNDTTFRIARGNTVDVIAYLENSPRLNALAMFEVGKTGADSPDGTTIVSVRGLNKHGRNTVEAGYNTTMFADIDHCTAFYVDGVDLRRFGAMLRTTALSKRISVTNTYAIGVISYLTADAVYDPEQHTHVGFRPLGMLFRPGNVAFWEGRLSVPDLQLAPRPRGTVTQGQLFLDISDKLMRRDTFGNFSSVTGSLTTDAVSGWTFNGGRLANGETIRRLTSDPGQTSEWRSMRHSVDTPVSVASCSTTNASPIITGAFTSLRVGDWVTVSAGLPSASTQYQIIAKADDNSTITIDTNATSTVAGTVTVASLAHSLEVIGQQGVRSVGVPNPIGQAVPRWTREIIYCIPSGSYWQAFGTTLNDWRLMGEQIFSGSLSVSPGLIAAGASWQGTITVPGATLTNFVDVSYTNTDAGLTISGRITATDTCTVWITNKSGAGITPAAGMVRVLAKLAVVA